MITSRLRSNYRYGLVLGAFATVSALVLAGCSGSETSTEAGSGNDCDTAPNYPKGPVEMVVPFAAGGGTDSVARNVAEQLGSALGTQVNVVNKTGGGGVVGHQAISQAAADGQTIGLVTAELGMLHHLGLTEVSPKSVTGIAQINEDPAGLTVAADSRFESATDIVDYAKENPGELVGSGTAQAGIWHVAIAGMLLEEGVDANAIRWVPSEGAAPALQELVAGGIDISSASLAENRTMIDSGRVKAIGVMADERNPDFEDVKTLKEQGIDYSLGTWRGISGPAGMPENVVAELECSLKNIVQSEEYTSFMADAGLGIQFRDATEFTSFMLEDDADKGKIIADAGLAE